MQKNLILPVIIFICTLLLASVCILIFGWVLSLALEWLFAFNHFQAFAIAMMALIVFAISSLTIKQFIARDMLVDSGLKSPSEYIDDDEDTLDAVINESPLHTWFRSCLCGSKRPFAYCCGKKAFKKIRD